MTTNQSRLKKKKLFLIAVVSFLLLIAYIVFSPFGILKHMRLQHEIEAVQKENSRLDSLNKNLSTEIKRLKTDPAYIEEIARSQYGLIKENEIVFEFKDKK